MIRKKAPSQSKQQYTTLCTQIQAQAEERPLANGSCQTYAVYSTILSKDCEKSVNLFEARVVRLVLIAGIGMLLLWIAQCIFWTGYIILCNSRARCTALHTLDNTFSAITLSEKRSRSQTISLDPPDWRGKIDKLWPKFSQHFVSSILGIAEVG